MRVITTGLVLTLLILQFGCATKEKKALVIYESKGDQFISYLTADDYGAAHKMLEAKAAKKLTLQKLKNAWLKSAKDLGKFEKVSQVHKYDNGENYFIEFDKAIRPLSLQHNKKGQITTVWFGSKYPVNHRSKYIRSFDGFPLNVLVETPTKKPKKVVIFIHGSGPNDWDEGKGALFKKIARSLNKSGIATIRFHKRTFEMQLMGYSDPDKLKSFSDKKFNNQFMKFFIEDTKAVANYSKKLFPKAEIVLFGHSQGTWVALQMASQNKQFKKLALLGSYNSKANETILIQTLYRYRSEFDRYDKNKNGELTRWELRKHNNILKQLPVLDLDNDKILSLSEWNAANYSNYYKTFTPTLKSWLIQEINHPTPYEILARGRFKAVFLHGEWDNQTPIYFPKSIQLLNNTAWKKNYSFKFFNKLGHGLNRQQRFMEFNDNEIERKALSEVTKELMTL